MFHLVNSGNWWLLGRRGEVSRTSYQLSDKHHRRRTHSPKPSVDGLIKLIVQRVSGYHSEHEANLGWNVV